jgi:hypothetical protein
MPFFLSDAACVRGSSGLRLTPGMGIAVADLRNRADTRNRSVEVVPTYLSCAIWRAFASQFRLPGALARLQCGQAKKKLIQWRETI